jgi:YgiT-type zinc finger domain-containing protein
MEKCPLCGGDKTEGHTTYSLDLGFGIVVVRQVPARVCAQCGEEWIDSETAQKLETIVERVRSQHNEVEVLQYKEVAK